MNKASATFIAAVAALTLSGGAFAQNNTLATPTTRSPAAPTSGYGTPGAATSDSGAGSSNSGLANGANANSAAPTIAYGSNNTLATPSVKSPVAR